MSNYQPPQGGAEALRKTFPEWLFPPCTAHADGGPAKASHREHWNVSPAPKLSRQQTDQGMGHVEAKRDLGSFTFTPTWRGGFQ